MKIGVFANAADLQQTRPWVYTPKGYEYGEDEERVVFHLRPWTRTTQGVVDKRARGKNIAIMGADEALKGIGTGDKRAEAYVRELADYLIEDWEGIVFASDHYDADLDQHFKKGEAMPCTAKYKVLLFEDVQVAVDIVEAAKGFATSQIAEESKNSERSSGGTDARENSQDRTSA